MRSFRTRVFALGIAALLVSLAGATGVDSLGAAPVAPAFVAPGGFTDTVVGRVPNPTDVVRSPDGRLLVTDQSGKVRVIKNGVTLATPALDITTIVCNGGERGLLGIALDPQFTTNHYVYIYYTFKKNGTCPIRTAQAPVNRVARFVMVGDRFQVFSHKVLLDNILSYAGNHNAGSVGFGRDGLLYVGVGDGGCDYTGATGCAASNAVSRRSNSLHGKVVRITRDGGIPAGNPFIGAGTARCNQGPIAAGQVCKEIYARGFRNPFRIAFDPDAASTRLFVNDVGQDEWEEIDNVVKGADYGWNIREGFCATGSTTNCGPPPAGLTNPIFAYGRANGCDVITGGAFVPDGVWPERFRNGYLYADFGCNTIFLLSPRLQGNWTATVFAHSFAGGGPVALLFAPHGMKTSLYYTTYANGGEVHVIDTAG